MRNGRLDELQAGIKIGGRNINNLRDVDDTTLMADSEEELKSLLMKVKEENERTSLKLNIKKTTIMASGPITAWQMEVGGAAGGGEQQQHLKEIHSRVVRIASFLTPTHF